MIIVCRWPTQNKLNGDFGVLCLIKFSQDIYISLLFLSFWFFISSCCPSFYSPRSFPSLSSSSFSSSSYLAYRSFAYTLQLPVLCFYGIPMCVNVCVYMCFLCSFFESFPYVCFLLFQFVCFGFYFILSLLLR